MGFLITGYRIAPEQTRDGEAKKTAVVLLRWVLVISTSCLILFSDDHRPDLAAHLVALSLIMSNIGVASLPSRYFNAKNFDSVLVSLDIVFVSVGLWISGHANGDFYLLYFLIIMISALGETLRAIIWSAFLVAVVYVTVTGTTGGMNALLNSEVLIRVPFFFIVAIFYGYFAQLVRSERSARLSFQTKWTLAKRLRELGAQLSSSLDRQEILRTLVVSQCEFCEVPYAAVFSRGTKTLLAEAGDNRQRPERDQLALMSASLERRILLKERGRIHLEDDSTASVMKGRPSQSEQSVVSFVEGNYTLVPMSSNVSSDLYLMLSGVVTGEVLEYVAVLLMSAAMALNNSAQYQALVHEVDKRQEVNRQLSEAVQFKSQFLANISHEIRTPLHSFIGFGELFLSGGYGEMNDEQTSVMSRMVKNAQSLLDLLNDILDLSKLEAGAMKIRCRAGSMQEFLDDIQETCMPLLSNKPVVLQVHSVEEIPNLVLDWGIMRQIAMNLVSNAIKFTAKGRVDLTVKYNPANERLTMIVRDTGVGIDPEKFGEIFEPFRQLENSYTKKYAGTGLGLAISRGQAELIGGTISVRSKLGSWSEFTLEMPASANPIELSPVPAPSATA